MEAMKVIFFSKNSKFYVDMYNAIKCEENFDAFKNNFVWSQGANFRQLWQECMWAALNVLKGGPKISDSTKRHEKQLNLFDINRKLA